MEDGDPIPEQVLDTVGGFVTGVMGMVEILVFGGWTYLIYWLYSDAL